MGLHFNPPKQVARYALFVDRGESFEISNNLATIKLKYHARGRRYNTKILENVDNEWYVLHDIQPNTDYKELPWVKTLESNWYRSRTAYRAVPMTRDEYADWRVAVEREKWEAEHKGLASSKRAQ